MNKVAKYTRLVEVASMLLIPTVIAGTVLKWTHDAFGRELYLMLAYVEDCAKTSQGVLENSFFTSSLYDLTGVPLLYRLCGFVIDAVAVVLMIWILLSIIKLMRFFRAGEFFSSTTVQLFSTISKIALALTIYNPLKGMLLSIILSLHKGPGLRHVTIAITSGDFINCLLFGLAVVLSLLLQEGYKLKSETDLVV